QLFLPFTTSLGGATLMSSDEAVACDAIVDAAQILRNALIHLENKYRSVYKTDIPASDYVDHTTFTSELGNLAAAHVLRTRGKVDLEGLAVTTKERDLFGIAKILSEQ
ncbi:hypothetical protein PMAYCL1PPCAC_22156, partial [Pristionchus mayeri]